MTVMNPWTPEIARIPDQVELLRKLDAHLNDEETRTLMFELGVDYDNLPATTKKGKLRELILFMERQSQSPRLWQFLRQRYNFIIGD